MNSRDSVKFAKYDADDADGLDRRQDSPRGRDSTYGVMGTFSAATISARTGARRAGWRASFYEGQTFLYELVKALAQP